MLLVAVTLAVVATTFVPTWARFLLPSIVDSEQLGWLSAFAIIGGPSVLTGLVVGLLSATLASSALRRAERSHRRSPWEAVLIAGLAASAGPALVAIATMTYFSGLSTHGMEYLFFYALVSVVDPYPVQLLASGVSAAVVVGSYRWSAGSENVLAPDAMNPRTGRWWVPVLAGGALTFAVVSLAIPVAMGFVYGGLNARWEPASPDLIDRLILQTSLLALIPLAATILTGAGRVLRVHNAIILSEQANTVQSWPTTSDDGGDGREMQLPSSPSSAVSPEEARDAMEQLIAQLVAVIGAGPSGALGEELRWLDVSDAGDSTGNDGYALAEGPGAVVEESCMDRAGIRYSMPPATFALGIITDTSSEVSDAEVIDANVAAAGRIVALLESGGYVEDSRLGGNIYVIGHEDAAAASVTIRLGFGTATVAADGLCVIDSR